MISGHAVVVLAAKATIDVFGASVVLVADTALAFYASGAVRSPKTERLLPRRDVSARLVELEFFRQ